MEGMSPGATYTEIIEYQLDATAKGHSLER
jgi:hypothetical protein